MKRIATVGIIAVSQLALVGLAVAPQLSARLTGDTYLVRVAPVDPIEPPTAVPTSSRVVVDDDAT